MLYCEQTRYNNINQGYLLLGRTATIYTDMFFFNVNNLCKHSWFLKVCFIKCLILQSRFSRRDVLFYYYFNLLFHIKPFIQYKAQIFFSKINKVPFFFISVCCPFFLDYCLTTVQTNKTYSQAFVFFRRRKQR